MTINCENQYVLVSTAKAGLRIGFLSEWNPATRHVLLEDARWLWWWSGAFTYYAIALNGVKEAKLSVVCPEVVLANVEEILALSDIAKTQLYGIPAFDPEEAAKNGEPDCAERFRRILIFNKESEGNGAGEIPGAGLLNGKGYGR